MHARAGGYVIGAGVHLHIIRVCTSTLYVGLMRSLHTLTHKSTGMVPPFQRLFLLRLKKSSGYMGTVMNK